MNLPGVYSGFSARLDDVFQGRPRRQRRLAQVGRAPRRPIVFFNGTTDPVDSPDNVAQAHKTTPNRLVAPAAGIGHWQLDFDPTGCLTEQTNVFLAQGKPSTPEPWACAQSIPLPDFAV